MKVTFPHLGHAYIAIEALLQAWVMSRSLPFNNQTHFEWGSRLSPEETCLPFKTILGNMLEGISWERTLSTRSAGGDPAVLAIMPRFRE